VSDIIFWMSTSVDGFMASPDGGLDWHLVDEEIHTHFNEELGAMAGFLGGRRTHELMAAYWPTADTDPASTEPEVEFARIWRDMPKTVYSTTLETDEWNTTVVRQVDPNEVRELKARAGGDLVVGGADLSATFMRLDLIDEYRIYVHPVVIGAGIPAFQASDLMIDLRLASTRTFGNGVVMLRYRRRAEPAPAAG
jgi:dihydrofolate reductase